MKDQQFSTLSTQPWSDLPWKGEILHIHGCFHLSVLIPLMLLHKQSLPHKQLLQCQTVTLHAKQCSIVSSCHSGSIDSPSKHNPNPRGDNKISNTSHIQMFCVQLGIKNSIRQRCFTTAYLLICMSASNSSALPLLPFHFPLTVLPHSEESGPLWISWRHQDFLLWHNKASLQRYHKALRLRSPDSCGQPALSV